MQLNTAKAKLALQSTALSTLRSAGLFSIAKRSARRRQQLLILCYHGLSMADEHEWLPHLFMTPQQFRARLACLREMNANVLPLEEGLARLWSGSLPETSVAITFDDGFVDLLHYGVPALAEFGFPATLYLTTHYMNYRLPIVNLVLDYILWKSGRETVLLPEYGITSELPIGSYAERQAVVRRLLQTADEAKLDTTAKDEMARAIAAELGVDYQRILEHRQIQILKPDEVVEAARQNIDVQMHTHRHRAPSSWDRDTFVQEIEDNRRAIRDVTNTNPVHFCYPGGDCGSMDVQRWLKESGVQSGTTCERGLASPEAEPLRLPRVLDDSIMSPPRFESFVSGFFA